MCCFLGAPYAPSSVTAKVSAGTLGNTCSSPLRTAITVNWTEPRFDGNSRLIAYEIYCRLVGEATSTITYVSKVKQSEMMPCLTAEGKYEITVFALNRLGQNGSEPFFLNFQPALFISGNLIYLCVKLM